jgi:hypothetical protein
VKASGSAGVWVLDAKGSAWFHARAGRGMDDASVQVTGLAAGSRVVSVGRQKLDAGMTVRAIERSATDRPPRREEQLMKRFNLSEWAVTHRPMVLFLIIATLIVGRLSSAGWAAWRTRTSTCRTMTAIVVWPGATAQEVQDQVLNRIERRLQELEHFEYVRSFARQATAASRSG